MNGDRSWGRCLDCSWREFKGRAAVMARSHAERTGHTAMVVHERLVVPGVRRGTGHRGDVPNGPMRDAYERAGHGATYVAREMGWFKNGPDSRPDANRVKRTLGMTSDRGVKQIGMRYSTAVALCNAIGCDPVDVGI